MIALTEVTAGIDAKEVYYQYISKRAKQMGFDSAEQPGFALTRLGCMLGINSAENAILLQQAFDEIPFNARAILIQELNDTGLDGVTAILPYGAHTLLTEICSPSDESGSFKDAAAHAMNTLAYAVHKCRRHLGGRRHKDGVATLSLSELNAAGNSAKRVIEYDIRMRGTMPHIVASPKDFPPLPRPTDIKRLDQVPLLQKNRDFAVIGLGGGTDCIQCAALARLLEGHGKRCRAVISTSSHGLVNVKNVGKGVLKVSPSSTGNHGLERILEPIVAEHFDTYHIVVGLNDEMLTESLRKAVKLVGDDCMLIAADTGGDALCSVGNGKITAALDQDLRVLLCLEQLKRSMITCEMACGIDSPEDVAELLQSSQAEYCELSAEEVSSVLEWYKQWRVDGSDIKRYGKTPYAWHYALEQKFGVQCLPLPVERVLRVHGYWDPFVFIRPVMQGMFFMTLEEHLKLIKR